MVTDSHSHSLRLKKSMANYIKVTVLKSDEGDIKGFHILNHGAPIVCSAVSALSFNTVNSVEELTQARFSLDMDENGGDMLFQVIDYDDHDASLLLKSLLLGLKAIELDYKDDIRIFD